MNYTLLTSKEFNEKYPNWSDPVNNEYTNLPSECFILTEGDGFVAIDNTDYWCWVEEFNTLEEAIKWINNED